MQAKMKEIAEQMDKSLEELDDEEALRVLEALLAFEDFSEIEFE